MQRVIAVLAVAAMLLGLPMVSGGCGKYMQMPASKKEILSLRKTDYVNLQEYIPTLVVDLVYFSEKNFTGQRLYESPVAYLRKGTADKLKMVAGEVGEKGYRLKIWDAYRPPGVQFIMWRACPRPGYVANPYSQHSDHSRGCAVDLTLVDSAGKELEMPSSFDEFSQRADRDYRDVSQARGANARYLEEVMVRHGFVPIRTEWWHFADSERKSYGVTENLPLPHSIPPEKSHPDFWKVN